MREPIIRQYVLPKAHDPSPPLLGARCPMLHLARPLTAASHTHTVRTDGATNVWMKKGMKRGRKRGMGKGKKREERTRSSIEQENCWPFTSNTVVDPIANQPAAPDIFKGNRWIGENSIAHRHLLSSSGHFSGHLKFAPHWLYLSWSLSVGLHW